jgi:two-component system, LytTR family, response regulator
MLHAIAIDDEPIALEVLKSHASKVPFLELRQTFVSTAEALAYMHQQSPDLLFLDIQMPDLDGLQFARMIQSLSVPVVFITAYPDHAVEGFQLEALDYLLKPVSFARFLQTCNRALDRKMQAAPTATNDHIFVKESYDCVRVRFEELLYVQSDTNLLFIHERQRRIITRMTLSELLEQLPADRFMRIHKSYVVALSAIQKIEKHQLTVGSALIPLAATYREELEKRLLGTVLK